MLVTVGKGVLVGVSVDVVVGKGVVVNGSVGIVIGKGGAVALVFVGNDILSFGTVKVLGAISSNCRLLSAPLTLTRSESASRSILAVAVGGVKNSPANSKAKPSIVKKVNN